tara:strand:+ start:54 stop:419 length:366 start_codon:yes stop_codon:yes gene_type:complete
MAEFKLDYKITSPQLYEGDTKLSRDTTRGNITVSADNLSEAKKIAADQIKQGRQYQRFADRLPSQDTFQMKKPRVSFLKPLKITGGSGSTAYGDKGIKEIFPRPTLAKKNYSNLHPRLKNK